MTVFFQQRYIRSSNLIKRNKGETASKILRKNGRIARVLSNANLDAGFGATTQVEFKRNY